MAIIILKLVIILKSLLLRPTLMEIALYRVFTTYRLKFLSSEWESHIAMKPRKNGCCLAGTLPPNKACWAASNTGPLSPSYGPVVALGFIVGVGLNSGSSGGCVTSSKPHMSSRILSEWGGKWIQYT